MPIPAQPLDSNYKPITNDLYDSVGKQFVTALAGTTVTASDGTVYAPTITQVASPSPLGATLITASSGNVAAATATATLAAVAGKTTFITGFTVTGTGAASGLAVSVTVTNVTGGTLTYTYAAAVGVAVANTPLIIQFPYPLPATAANTTIVVSCPALTGSTNNTVNAFGFQQ